jgi:MOSC domain-containing protein YiiM
MSEPPAGKVLGIALRGPNNGKMTLVDEAAATVDGGLNGDVEPSPHRGVTFIAAGQWEQVTRELGADLPWHTRRANVLVDATGLGHLIGRRIRVGEVEVQIKAVTEPCGLMDKLHDGLRQALVPDARGGVYGRVVKGGSLRVGDEIVTVESDM